MQGKRQPDTVYKLDSEDYENIYLRLQQRIWKAVFGIAGVTSLIGLTTYYSVINEHAEKQIKEAVETKEFQQILISTAMSKLNTLEERLATTELALQQATRQAANLSELPISISDKSLTLTDKSGEAVQIEYGMTRIGHTKFKNRFQSPPLIMVTPVGLDGISKLAYYAVNVTNDGFSIPLQSEHLRFRYIAIGESTYTPIIQVRKVSPP